MSMIIVKTMFHTDLDHVDIYLHTLAFYVTGYMQKVQESTATRYN